MFDDYRRSIDYMRVSITDRCNLRCIYCMPSEGIELLSHKDVLRFDEIVTICRSAAKLGIEKIKITGGEPLVRLGVTDLIRKIKAVEGIKEVTLTTNGVLLSEYIDELAVAGINGINISVDALDEKAYQEITGFDVLDKVYESIDKTLKYPNIPLKVNCVPFKKYNNKEVSNICKLVNLAKENPIHVRFIEMMPIGYGKEHEYINEKELVEEIEKEYGKLIPFTKKLGNGPCRYYELEGFKGKIGFISAISHKFCHTCNRVRLTSHGTLKTCLQYEAGEDLRKLLREGASEGEITEAIKKAICEKPKGHIFEGLMDNTCETTKKGKECTYIEESGQIPENQLLMSEIGG